MNNAKNLLLALLILLYSFGRVMGGTMASDKEAAIEDRSQFPVETWNSIYYFTTACVEEHDDTGREQLANAFKLVCFLTSKGTVVHHPVQITDTLWRVDLLAMGWDLTLWKKVTALNGYDTFADNLVLRADWFVVTMTDCRESDAYYLATLGVKPKTRDEAWGILGVVTDTSKRYGIIEGDSQVSHSGVRRIENLPVVRGAAWRTRDSIDLNLENDPLEQIEGDFVHDAEEHIILQEVHDPVSGARGVRPFYLLTDGKGNVVDKADPRIVEDTTRFRGYPEIGNAGSCIQCHAAGGNYPTKDDFRTLLDSGVRTLASFEDIPKLQAFYFVNLTKDIDRWNEDYRLVYNSYSGVTPVTAAGSFKGAVDRYDEPLDLNRAAWESGVSGEELGLALAWARSTGIRLPGRTVGLEYGRNMPRDAADSGGILALKGIVDAWRIR